jgi:hypothetical protein
MSPRRTFALLVVAGGLTTRAPAAQAQTAPVTGEVKDAAGTVIGTVEATFTLTGFFPRQGELFALGRLNGVIKNPDGTTLRQIQNVRVALPVDLEQSWVGVGGETASAEDIQAAALQCDVLNLVLGPLDLNLLGLEIHLNQVILDIVANPAGGLLGQILEILCGLSLSDLLGNLFGNLGALATLLNILLFLL